MSRFLTFDRQYPNAILTCLAAARENGRSIREIISSEMWEHLITGENHITLAWGRDYGDVTPVKGVVMGGGIHTLSVMLDVAVQP